MRFLRNVALKLKKRISTETVAFHQAGRSLPVEALQEKIGVDVKRLRRVNVRRLYPEPSLDIVFSPGRRRLNIRSALCTGFNRFISRKSPLATVRGKVRAYVCHSQSVNLRGVKLHGGFLRDSALTHAR